MIYFRKINKNSNYVINPIIIKFCITGMATMENKYITNGMTERRKADFTPEPIFPNKRLSIEISNICNHKCFFCPNSKILAFAGTKC